MANTFKDYAKIYDIIYRKKHYLHECLFLEKVFKRYAKKPVRDLLDVACGTGNHIIPLAKRHYNVSAQDISSSMLKIAKGKSRAQGLDINFTGSFAMQKFSHRKKFDAVIAMFSSVDYLLKLSDLKKAFGNIKKCLKEDGIFVFDFWNRDCVEKYFSPYKKKIFSDGNKKVVRISETFLDKKAATAIINYTCDLYVGGRHLKQIKELHKMKYHKISAMQKTLASCGFKTLGIFPFMHLNQKITDKDWNISVVVTHKK